MEWGAGFIPVGLSSPYFSGSLDGKGYTVTDLFINRQGSGSQYAALIGRNLGTVRNLTLANCNLTAISTTWNSLVSGIVVFNREGGLIENCHVSGTLLSGDIAESSYGIASGIAAENSARISECSSSATINAKGEEAYASGISESNYGTISESSSTGAISAEAVDEAYAAGCVVTNYAYTWDGDDYDGRVDNSYARGSVTASATISFASGFVHHNYDDGNFEGTMLNSYAANTLSANTKAGFCYDNDATITACFWDTETSGVATSEGGTGKTTAEMKAILTFSAWDIGVAAETRNDGYPFLGWEIDSTGTIWLIYEEAETTSPPYTTPDIYDWKGRVAKGARAQAYRTDTDALVETQTINQYGNATFTALPNDVDIRFIVNWGGTAQTHKSRTFTRRVEGVTDGGTGSSLAPTARDNLGVGATVSIWSLILGD